MLMIKIPHKSTVGESMLQKPALFLCSICISRDESHFGTSSTLGAKLSWIFG